MVRANHDAALEEISCRYLRKLAGDRGEHRVKASESRKTTLSSVSFHSPSVVNFMPMYSLSAATQFFGDALVQCPALPPDYCKQKLAPQLSFSQN